MVFLPSARKSTLKQYKACVTYGNTQVNIDFSITLSSCDKNNKLKIILHDNNCIYVSETYLSEHSSIIHLIKKYANGTQFIDRLMYLIRLKSYEIEYDNNEYIISFTINTGYEIVKYRYVCSLYREDDINDLITTVNDVNI